jgi:hypothetical protein
MFIYNYMRHHSKGVHEFPEWYTLEDAIVSARMDIEYNEAYPISIEDNSTGRIIGHDDIIKTSDTLLKQEGYGMVLNWPMKQQKGQQS